MTSEETRTSENMTMEETIDTLKGLVFGTFDRTTAKEREALDMAIKALEQQPKIDEIIKRIEEARDKDKIAEYPYNRCIKIIREVLGDD